jgi:hypothetical protein
LALGRSSCGREGWQGKCEQQEYQRHSHKLESHNYLAELE